MGERALQDPAFLPAGEERLPAGEERLPPEEVRKGRGFSFLEITVVMGAMAMLAALAVGYIGNIGQGTYLAQAKGMLSETAFRCIGGSVGGRRAEFTLRQAVDADGRTQLRIGAIVARPVLTHQFEELSFASGGSTPQINGQVEILAGAGRTGNAGLFKGGYLAFDAQSRFAMTEGIEVDVYVKPDPFQRVMSIVRGGESYEVMLIQRGDGDAYDVRLSLKMRKASESRRSAAIVSTFETSGGNTAPVSGDGRWSHVQVGFHGLEPSMRVNGLERYTSKAAVTGRRVSTGGALGAGELEAVRRIVVPGDGALPLTISSGERPFQGQIDGFRLMGVFRSQELERDLPGTLEVIYPSLPLRIAFANGGLDPDVHNGDLMIRLLDTSHPEDPPLRLTLGMDGKVSSFYEKPGQGGPDVREQRTRSRKKEGE